MSAIKDIMTDVDVEPLESQAFRRSREAAQRQRELDNAQSPAQSHSQLPPSYNPRPQDPQAPPLKRRRSDRSSKTSVPPPSSSRSSIDRRRSSGATDSMEGYGYGQNIAHQASSSNSFRHSSRGSDPAEPQVKLTPITGRVSRARKGQPVHVCEQCNPPRIFTRAEHLRRHQLGHDKPRYPCTFEDCEKSFHRPDLLARHLSRHDSGEKAFRAGDARSARSLSSSSDSQSPPLKVVTPLSIATSASNPTYTGSNPSQGSTNPGGLMTATTLSSDLQNVTFSGSSSNAPSNPQGPGSARNLSMASPRNSTALGGMGHAYPTTPMHSPHHSQDAPLFSFGTLNQPYDPMYAETASGNPFGSSNTTGLLRPTLQIPDVAIPPGLSYTNSPWYSSEGTWSTTPSDTSRIGSAYPRSASEAPNHEWPNPSISWSPGLHNSRSPMETMPEHQGSSPFLSPPMPAYHSVGMSSPVRGYQMEIVGTPTFPNFYKPTAQTLPAQAPPPSFQRGQNAILGVRHVVSPKLKAHTVLLTTQMDTYISSYKTHFEPIFPCIHHESLNNHLDGLLKHAMAALGTQYSTNTNDRREGIKLYEICKRRILLPSEWTVQTIQTVLLTEVFARFRSLKVDVRQSHQFNFFYKKLIEAGEEDKASIFTTFDIQQINAYIEELLLQHRMEGSPNDRQHIKDMVWREWIQYETRQRLRAAYFVMDVHLHKFYEQRRCHPGVNSNDSILLLPCSDRLWNAKDATKWYDEILQSNYSAIPLSVAENMSIEEISSLPRSCQLLITCSLTTQLRPRDRKSIPEVSVIESPIISKITTTFPHFSYAHAYLALHHTPLHELLALTGSTWVLGKKLTIQEEIDRIETHVHQWTKSLAAAQATWHACHVLQLCLSQPIQTDVACVTVCEYWCIYTATLICWAFGHRTLLNRYRTAQLPVVAPAGTNNTSRQSSCTAFDDDPAEITTQALAYLQEITSSSPEQVGDLFLSPVRGDTMPLMQALRNRLELEDMGGEGRCAMLTDACGVIDRLLEGGKWF